jgi:hypothetical protein
MDNSQIAVHQAAILLGSYYNIDPMQLHLFGQLHQQQMQQQQQSLSPKSRATPPNNTPPTRYTTDESGNRSRTQPQQRSPVPTYAQRSPVPEYARPVQQHRSPAPEYARPASSQQQQQQQPQQQAAQAMQQSPVPTYASHASMFQQFSGSSVASIDSSDSLDSEDEELLQYEAAMAVAGHLSQRNNTHTSMRSQTQPSSLPLQAQSPTSGASLGDLLNGPPSTTQSAPFMKHEKAADRFVCLFWTCNERNTPVH